MIEFELPISNRSLKVSSLLKKALSELFMREFYELSKLVSISAVRVSDDIRNATVLFVVSDVNADKEEIVRALNDAADDVIRRMIFRHLKLRNVPRLHFKLDLEFENFLGVSKALSALDD